MRYLMVLVENFGKENIERENVEQGRQEKWKYRKRDLFDIEKCLPQVAAQPPGVRYRVRSSCYLFYPHPRLKICPPDDLSSSLSLRHLFILSEFFYVFRQVVFREEMIFSFKNKYYILFFQHF